MSVHSAGGDISYKEIHRRLRKSEGYKATDALWNAKRKTERLFVERSTIRAGVFDGNNLPEIPIPATEIRTMASPRPQFESRAAAPRWRSAHRTFSGWAPIGDAAGDLPTDFIGANDFRRRANSKLPTSRASEQAGAPWKELYTGEPWISPRANQLDTRPEVLRHVQSHLPPGNTAAERLAYARAQATKTPSGGGGSGSGNHGGSGTHGGRGSSSGLSPREPAVGVSGGSSPRSSPRKKAEQEPPLKKYAVPEASRFALAKTIPQNHDAKYVATAMPIGVSMRSSARGGPKWGLGAFAVLPDPVFHF